MTKSYSIKIIKINFINAVLKLIITLETFKLDNKLISSKQLL